MNTTISQKIISDFSKTLSKNKKEKSEKIVKGKIIGINNEYYVRLCDYSEDSKEFSSSINIPLKSTANIDITKPVNVLIKNHTAIVIGNINDNSNDKYNLNDDNKYEDSPIINNTQLKYSTIVAIPQSLIDKLWE
ncbi:MAG: hypothetical protein SPI36_02545 [Candidatus Onthovivens sp.]|nr:hypothetical protein [Candidatus Onthovivens sp.]